MSGKAASAAARDPMTATTSRESAIAIPSTTHRLISFDRRRLAHSALAERCGTVSTIHTGSAITPIASRAAITCAGMGS